MPHGVIKKVVMDKGFGFIEGEGQDLFFHCSSVQEATFEDLIEGAAVEYEREESPRGARAVRVRILEGAPVVTHKSNSEADPGKYDSGSEGSSSKPQKGAIKKVVQDRGFGFIGAEGRDIFFHCSQVRETEFESLLEGQTVEYTIGRGPHGPRAENVRPVQETANAST